MKRRDFLNKSVVAGMVGLFYPKAIFKPPVEDNFIKDLGVKVVSENVISIPDVYLMFERNFENGIFTDTIELQGAYHLFPPKVVEDLIKMPNLEENMIWLNLGNGFVIKDGWRLINLLDTSGISGGESQMTMTFQRQGTELIDIPRKFIKAYHDKNRLECSSIHKSFKL